MGNAAASEVSRQGHVLFVVAAAIVLLSAISVGSWFLYQDAVKKAEAERLASIAAQCGKADRILTEVFASLEANDDTWRATRSEDRAKRLGSLVEQTSRTIESCLGDVSEVRSISASIDAPQVSSAYGQVCDSLQKVLEERKKTLDASRREVQVYRHLTKGWIAFDRADKAVNDSINQCNRGKHSAGLELAKKATRECTTALREFRIAAKYSDNERVDDAVGTARLALAWAKDAEVMAGYLIRGSINSYNSNRAASHKLSDRVYERSRLIPEERDIWASLSSDNGTLVGWGNNARTLWDRARKAAAAQVGEVVAAK